MLVTWERLNVDTYVYNLFQEKIICILICVFFLSRHHKNNHTGSLRRPLDKDSLWVHRIKLWETEHTLSLPHLPFLSKIFSLKIKVRIQPRLRFYWWVICDIQVSSYICIISDFFFSSASGTAWEIYFSIQRKTPYWDM